MTFLLCIGVLSALETQYEIALYKRVTIGIGICICANKRVPRRNRVLSTGPAVVSSYCGIKERHHNVAGSMRRVLAADEVTDSRQHVADEVPTTCPVAGIASVAAVAARRASAI